LLPTSLVNQGAQLLPTSLANRGAQLINPSVAGTLASTQYDQAIADAQAALKQQQSDNAQMLANVGNWYQQVLDSQGRAAQADSNTFKAVQGSERDANAAILASLGGGANAAAPAVAAAGADNVGTLGALGAIQDAYNADIVPILNLGKAGALNSQQAANARLLAGAFQNVQDLTAQKGAAEAQYGYDILGQNNQIRDAQANRLLQILGANNDVRGNRVSQLASIVGANNSVIGQQKGDARANAQLGLDRRQLADSESQNKILAILSATYDPQTGGLTPEGRTLLGKYLKVDPNALTGTDAANAARIIGDRTSAAVSAAGLAERRRHDQVLEDQGATRNAISKQRADATVKKATTPKAISDKDAANLVSTWKAGKSAITSEAEPNPDRNGNPVYRSVRKQTGQVSYQDAIKRANALSPDNRKKVIAQINAQYAPGENGRPWGALAGPHAIETAKVAFQAGLSVQDARAKMLAAGLPKAAVDNAITQIYYTGSPYSPINGVPPKAQ